MNQWNKKEIPEADPTYMGPWCMIKRHYKELLGVSVS